MAHSRLFEFYNSPGFARVDLALRELDAMDDVLREKPNKTETEKQQLKKIGELRDKMSEHIQQLNTVLEKEAYANANPLQLAQIAAQRFNCPAVAFAATRKKLRNLSPPIRRRNCIT